MQESSVYRHIIQKGIEQGIEQGARATAIESIFTVLNARFDVRAVQRLKPIVEQIEDVQHLKQLLPAEDLAAFQQMLEV